MTTPITIAVPDCRFHYQLGEQTYAVDPIEAIEESNRLIEACKTASGFVYLDGFAAWLHQTQGWPEKLDRAIVDWLVDNIHARYAEVKKNRFEPLNSPASMESTHSG